MRRVLSTLLLLAGLLFAAPAQPSSVLCCWDDVQSEPGVSILGGGVGGGGGSGGALVPLGSVSLSGTSNVVDVGEWSSFKRIIILFHATTDTDDDDIFLRVSDDDGSTYEATSYKYTTRRNHSNGGADGEQVSASATYVPLTNDAAGWGLGSDTGEHADIWITIDDPGNTSTHKTITVTGGYDHPSQWVNILTTAKWFGDVTGIDEVEITSAGSLSGTAWVWGITAQAVASSCTGGDVLGTLTGTGSSNTLTFEDGDSAAAFDGTYARLEFRFVSLSCAADCEVRMQYSQSSTYATSSYYWAATGTAQDADSPAGSTSDNSIEVTFHHEGDTAEVIVGTVTVWDPSRTDSGKPADFVLLHQSNSSPHFIRSHGHGWYTDNDGAIDGIRFIGRNTSDSGDVNFRSGGEVLVCGFN